MTSLTCPSCGAATPLPDEDLQRPTYPCPACGRVVSTAEGVGARVVAADAFVGELRAVLAGAAEAPTTRPGDATAGPPRPSACVYCRAPVLVPMALRERDLTCPSCGKLQAIAAHVSDGERLRVDLERQLAQNRALQDIRAAGLACPSCGARMSLPAGAVQASCPHCGSAVSLAAVAGEDAVARERLGQVRAVVGEAVAAQEARRRWVERAILGGIVLAVAGVLGGMALVGLLGAGLAALRG